MDAKCRRHASHRHSPRQMVARMRTSKHRLSCSLAPGPRGSATCAVSVRALVMPRAGWHANPAWQAEGDSQSTASASGPGPSGSHGPLWHRTYLTQHLHWLAMPRCPPATGSAGPSRWTLHSAEDPARGAGGRPGPCSFKVASVPRDAPAAGTSVARCCNIAGH